jgi:hypothetical protein
MTSLSKGKFGSEDFCIEKGRINLIRLYHSRRKASDGQDSFDSNPCFR